MNSLILILQIFFIYFNKEIYPYLFINQKIHINKHNNKKTIIMP